MLLLFASTALAQAPSSYKPYASLADIMAGILLPKSNTVFDTAPEIPDAKGILYLCEMIVFHLRGVQASPSMLRQTTRSGWLFKPTPRF